MIFRLTTYFKKLFSIVALNVKISNLQKRKFSLDADISTSTITLDSLSVQIEEAAATLESLMSKIKLAEDTLADTKLYHDTLQKQICEAEIQLQQLKSKTAKETNSLDPLISDLVDKYPGVHAAIFDYNCCQVPKYAGVTASSLRTSVDSQLTQFAINHCINPEHYKEIMYDLNPTWYSEIARNDVYYYSSTLPLFTVLVDDNLK